MGSCFALDCSFCAADLRADLLRSVGQYDITLSNNYWLKEDQLLSVPDATLSRPARPASFSHFVIAVSSSAAVLRSAVVREGTNLFMFILRKANLLAFPWLVRAPGAEPRIAGLCY